MLYGCSAVGRKKEIGMVSFEDRTHPQVFRLIRHPAIKQRDKLLVLFQKKSRPFDLPCARNRTRTCTPVRILVPETSASTNSAIRANNCKQLTLFAACAQDKIRTCTP